MILRYKIVIVLAILFATKSAYAVFPQDFSDVIWAVADTNIEGFAVASDLDASVSGGSIIVNHTKKNSWPSGTSLGGGNANCCNANVWGFVKINGQWHGGTWEYLRPGQTVKGASAFGGPGHFRPPINTFNKVNGEIYGFMVSTPVRDNYSPSVRERSNVVLWRWGVGEVPFGPEPEPEPEPVPVPEPESAPVITPIVDLLLN